MRSIERRIVRGQDEKNDDDDTLREVRWTAPAAHGP